MWWTNTDDWFKEFMADLFGSAVGLGVSFTVNPVYDYTNKPVADAVAKVDEVTSDQERRALGQTPSPSPTPTVTTAATPSPQPSGKLPSYAGQTMSDDELVAQARQNAQDKRSQASTQRQTQGTVGGLDPSTPVYDPRKKTTQVGPKGEFAPKVTKIETSSLGDAAREPFGWSDEKVKQVAQQMINAGYLSPNAVIDRLAVAGVWEKLAITSALMFQQGKKRTPMELLSLQSYGGQGGVGGTGGPKTVTQTSTDYSVTNATTARQLAQAALSARVGRKATDEEVSAFVAALRAEEKQNPQVTKSTTTTNADGTSQTSTSTVRQGVDVRAFADSYAMDYDTEEAKAYQAAGIMMPWFFEALRAPG